MSHRYSSMRATNSTNVRAVRLRRNASVLLLSLGSRLAPEFTRRYVSSRFFAPTCYPLAPEHRQVLEQGEAFTVSVRGRNVQCRRWGKGPAVLFAHGWNGRGVFFHRFFGPLRAAGFACVTFDAPAHGESGGRATSYFEFSDTVRALLNDPQAGEVRAVIAHSLGGSAAVNALEKEARDIPLVLLAPALRLREILLETFHHYGVPSGLYTRMVAELGEDRGYDLERDNPARLLPRVPGRVLIFHDTGDETIPYPDSEALAASLDRVTLRTTRRLGHKRIIAAPHVIREAVDFIVRGCGG